MRTTLASYVNFEIKQSGLNKCVILSKIIGNYLTTYFRDENILVSIITDPSAANRSHFQKDFFLNLFDNLAVDKFNRNSLNALDTSIHGYRNAFNLILIDNMDMLP